jgi:hypothetical protein
MNEFVLIFDLISALGIIAVAYILYKRFFSSAPSGDEVRNRAYEEGFSDAVRYFGLKKLYEDDAGLRRRMEEVFHDAGLSHRIIELMGKSTGNREIVQHPDRSLGGKK